MKSFGAVVRDIKSLKIQGAEQVAIAAVKAWENAKDKGQAARLLEDSRPTEPMLRNVLKYLKMHGEPERLLGLIEKGTERISLYGSRLVKDNSIVYTHCHSSTVEGILKKAWDEGKRFEVHVTETRPLFQGRITAINLSRHHIKVKMFVDSAALYALSGASMMLIGSDAITSDGEIVNKVGSRLFAKAAFDMGIPVYAAADSLKFDPKTRYGFAEKIENRSGSEVWPQKPRGIEIANPAFEVVPNDYVEAVITEFGVLKPEALVTELERKYAWLFER